MRYVARVTIAVGIILVIMAMVPFIRGGLFVVRAANVQGAIQRLAEYDTSPVVERPVTLDLESGSIAGRVYAPAAPSRQTVLLVAGLHTGGIDEPRLIAVARELARTRLTVVTPDIPELRQFAITPPLTDRIEQAAAWLAASRELAPSGRIGLMGISFSGGLAVVAAGRPRLRERLLYVFALGAHDDLPRVLSYLCGVPAGDASTPPPHEYGAAIVLLNIADDVVPATQVDSLRDVVRRFLHASALETTDRAASEREFAAVRETVDRSASPSRELLDALTRRDVTRLGAALLPHLGPYGAPAALSPSKSPPPAAPVFLLHGREDNIVPASESEQLAGRLRGHTRVRVLVSDVVSHVEANPAARIVDIGRLAAFWGDLLDR